MKTTYAPHIWQASRLANYTRAVIWHSKVDELPDVADQQRRQADAAVYAACGSPYGDSPHAQWVWWEFGQWETIN